jgi:endonuclease YncB( thermonuclease family)
MGRIVMLALIVLLAACSQPDPEQPPAGTPVPPPATDATLIEASVTRVLDGNTLDSQVLGRRLFVAYVGAEAVEANQPCGAEARARNRELAGDRVLLEADPGFQNDDRGRGLYYAFTLDRVSIDETLIREGLARAVRTDARYGAYLLAVEEEARAARRGCLWSDEP